MANAEEKLEIAMLHLMRTSNNAFVVGLLMNLPREICTDTESIELHGVNIKYNENYINGLDDNDLKFNLMHLAWHIPFFDEVRAQQYENPKVWNDACDNYINLMIKDDTGCGVEVPHNAKCERRFRGKEKEEIYNILVLEDQQNKQNQPDNDPMAGDLGDGTGDSQQGDGDAPLEDQLQNIVQQAAMQAKGCGGDVPNQVQSWLDDLYNPQLNWNQILAKYMDSFAKEDYTYARINKHYFPHDIILPTLHSEGLGRIVFATDESGSVSDKEYEAYIGAITDVHTRLNPETLELLSFTTRVTNHHVITDDDDIGKIKFRGNGGTDIPCVFDYVESNGLKPQVLIIFSDMDSALPKVKPTYDVIWIACNAPRFKPPFGKAIYVEIK